MRPRWLILSLHDMPLKKLYPLTNPRRIATAPTFSELTKHRPEKALLVIRRRSGGRNNQGKITVRHRGGGAKRYTRRVDFRMERLDSPAIVRAIEYDPNRGARLALVEYADKEKRYIIAPDGLAVGQSVVSSRRALPEFSVGSRTALEYIPVGTMVHNVEITPGRGGVLVRGAGNATQLLSLDGPWAQLKLPSSEVRLLSKNCAASIGAVSNPDHSLRKFGSAGIRRHLGWRPSVRGKAMNPVDHPHGGGEGKHPIGMKHPKTPWGKNAFGVKTRNRKKYSNRMILQRRQRK